MDSKFQSSFIPKTSTIGSNYVHTHEKTSVFGKLVSFIFILSLLGLVGLFGYKKFVVEKVLEETKLELATVEAAVDKGSIEALSSFDKKLKAAKDMVRKHVAFSAYLDFLEENTLSSVSYSSLTYFGEDSGKPVSISLVGSAPSFAAIAQMEKILLANPNVVSVDFSGFKLDKVGGVSFALKTELKNDLINWSNLTKATNSEVVSPAPSATSTATSTNSI